MIGEDKKQGLFVPIPQKRGEPIPLIPGIQTSIKEIPAGITVDHNQVYAHWENSGLKNAELLHIDAHEDMDYADAKEDTDTTIPYWRTLSIASFIVPAVHYGIVSSVYWLNPHSEEQKLQDLGATEINSRLPLRVEKYHDTRIKFRDRENCGEYFNGAIIDKISLPEDKPFILDIDLDAFCCHRRVHNLPKGYNGIEKYNKRLKETMRFVEEIKKKPDLITITLSAGQRYIGKPRPWLSWKEHSDGGYDYVVECWCPEPERIILMEKTIRELERIF